MSHISDSDHRRLDATVFPDHCVVENTLVSDASRGLRRVPVTRVWRTERLLGRGGFAEVHLQSQDTDKDSKRALKIIPTRGMRMSQEDCKRELTALIEFTKPKYKDAAVFVDFIGWFQNNDAMFLVMEFMPLGDLEQNIQQIEKSSTHTGPSLPEEEAQEITRQILEGLKIMHAEGFAHRDLKPQNVFVVQKHPNWWVKLGDFGLSKKRTEETAYRTQAGTQQYMAPELFYYVQELDTETSEYTNAIDLWSLGCIIHRVVTGAVPFPSLLSLRNYCRDPSRLLNIPHSMEAARDFVKELLAPHPAQRPGASAALESTWLTTKATFAQTSISRDTNNYNTTTHKGLQSFNSWPSGNDAALGPSTIEPASAPLPPPTSKSISSAPEVRPQLMPSDENKQNPAVQVDHVSPQLTAVRYVHETNRSLGPSTIGPASAPLPPPTGKSISSAPEVRPQLMPSDENKQNPAVQVDHASLRLKPLRYVREKKGSSTPTHISTGSYSAGGFNLTKPTDDRVIEEQFLALMQKRGWHNLPEQAIRQMTAYPAAKKWTLVHQDRLTEWQTKQKQLALAQQVGQYGAAMGVLAGDDEEGTPEWFVRRVIDNRITAKQLLTLSVSLRTQPIGWVKRFVECQGQVALTNVLRKMSQQQVPGLGQTSATKDLDREYDIAKCLKALMNTKFGADDALAHQQVIVSLVNCLLSVRITTRKLVSEILTFLCHWADGQGHSKVIQTMDYSKDKQGEKGRFDAWMRILEVSVDSRGKMESLVGASEEFRSGGIGMENLLMEYAVATLFLINMIIDTPEKDLQLRVHLRSQFAVCGLKRILTKMEAFQYEIIDRQIENFYTNEAIDYEDLLEPEDNSKVAQHRPAEQEQESTEYRQPTSNVPGPTTQLQPVGFSDSSQTPMLYNHPADSSKGNESSAKQKKGGTPSTFSVSILNPFLNKEKGVFPIYVQFTKGDRVNLEVTPNHTILEVKRMIEEQRGIHPQDQRLVYASKLLRKDDNTLGDYKIQANCTLHMFKSKSDHLHPSSESAGERPSANADRDQEVKIFIEPLDKLPSGSNVKYPLTVRLSDTVQNVKVGVREARVLLRGKVLPAQRQELKYKGETLQDGDTLSSYSIENGSVVQLSTR